MPNKLSIIFLLLHITIGQLRFNVKSIADGAVSMQVKTDKVMHHQLGEDARMATPFGLAVADGVGGSDFLSFYLASYLTIYAAETFILSQNNKVDFRQKIDERLNASVKMYKQNAFKLVRGSPFKPSAIKKQDEFFVKTCMVSSTLVAAFIDNNGPKPMLTIFKRGDSAVAVFTKMKSKMYSNRYHYVLKLVSQSNTLSFNAPGQFMAYMPNPVINDSNFEQTEISEGDIVLIGSDGFFDNVHLSLISYVLNWITFQIQSKAMADWDWKKDMETLAKTYVDCLNDQSKKEQEELARKRKAEREARKNEEAESCFGCFNFWSKKPKKDDKKPREQELNEQDNNTKIDSKDPPAFQDIENVSKFGGCTAKQLLYSPTLFLSRHFLISACVDKTIDEMFSIPDDSIDPSKDFDINTVSNILKELAYHLSIAENYKSPFYLEASKKYMSFEQTGKPDDITIIAAMVEPDESINQEVPMNQNSETQDWKKAVTDRRKRIDVMMSQDLSFMLLEATSMPPEQRTVAFKKYYATLQQMLEKKLI
jgi:serine/threonine protein phosphatase PrpC